MADKTRRVSEPEDRQPGTRVELARDSTAAPSDQQEAQPKERYELERIAETGNLAAARAVHVGDTLGLVPEVHADGAMDVAATYSHTIIGYLPEAAVDGIAENQTVTIDTCEVAHVDREDGEVPRVWVVL